MINFVICEDEIILAKNYKKIIDNFMMNYDMEYKIDYFDGYNSKFYDFVKEEKAFKIYIIDIKTNKGSGLDAARKIREEYDDWTSIIIIITAYQEFKYEALGSRLIILDFINKLNNCDQTLKDDLKRALKHFDGRDKSLKYEYNHIYHNIELKKIVYIEKEQDSKRCIIHTQYKDYPIQGTLTDLLQKLDKRFIKVHRSLIINEDQIDNYSHKENKLTFKTGETTYLISRNNKKELTKYDKCNI